MSKSDQSVTLRSVKSFVGQRLNVTLADCAVLVNVKLKRIDGLGRLVFDDPKLPRLELCAVTLLWPVSTSEALLKSSTQVQHYRHDTVDKSNAWRRKHRCGAWRCDRNPKGDRLLGLRKCAGCPSLQEVS